MSTADRMVVTCPTCGTETRLSNLDGGDTCPDCQTPIPDDAPTKIPTDVVGDRLDKAISEEPMGGYEYEQDEVTEPDRDVEAITETLTAVEQGDHVTFTIGAQEFRETVTMYVLSHEEDVPRAGFQHRVNCCPRPREDGWTRLYMTGIARQTELDSWEIVSAPYDLEGDGTMDARDYAAHGWVIDAEVTDEPVDRIDGGESA